MFSPVGPVELFNEFGKIFNAILQAFERANLDRYFDFPHRLLRSLILPVDLLVRLAWPLVH